MTDRLVTATINLANYRHNITQLQKIVPPATKVMAVIKANAYGHGIAPIAKAAVDAGASYLGVVSLGELRQIRQAGVTTPVLLLNYIDETSITAVLELEGSLTVMDSASITAAQAAAVALSKTARIHLEIDTGMHRAGCSPSDALLFAKQIAAAPNLELEGVFTHFAESEDHQSSFTSQQLDIFNECLTQLAQAAIQPPLIHAANSAAILTRPDTHFTLVRPGLITYGITPLPPAHPLFDSVQKNFLPVLSLHTFVVHIRTLSIGDTVGYNRTWRAERPSTVALLPVGYGDGWRRSPYSAGQVIIRDTFAPIIGAVSMDQIVIDITDIPDVHVGDPVTLLGSSATRSLSAIDIANAYHSIPYEVVTSLAERIDRHYK